LMRLEALSQLSSGNLTVAAARVLLFLLFLVIECLPVTVKLLQRPGQYEAALREAKKAEQRDYQKFFSTRSRLRPAPPAAQPSAAPPGRPPVPRAAVAAEPGPEPIWNATRRMPTVLQATEDETPTAEFHDPGFAPEDSTRPDYHWRGADAWRNHWSHQEEDPDAGGGRRVAPTRVDYAYPDAARDDRYRGQAGPDTADAYHEPGVPALEPPSDDDDESASARAAGNGGGIPLSWDDE
jgi:Domain of unknown function (DUF4407)